MKIVFIHGGNEQMASFRYRVKMPSEQLKKLGFDVSINQGEADIAIFSKPVHEDVLLAERCKKDGTHIVVDICDNHFNHPVYAGVYRKILDLADTVICPTKSMAKVILTFTGKTPYIIGDPYEFERQTPHAEGPKMLWFGHQSNLPEIIKWIPHLDKSNLRLVTGKTDQITGYTPWSYENLKAELYDSNMVLLPNSDKSYYKSNNRLINAVMAGCFPICEPHPAYHEFRKFVWVGRFMTGLQWANGYRPLLNDLVAECQEYIIKTYSLEIIGAKWADLLDCISEQATSISQDLSISTL